MSNIERILDLVPPEIGQTAFIHSDQSYSTFDFHGFIRASDERVRELGIKAFDRVVLKGDFSPITLATMIALIKVKATIIPVTPESDLRLNSELLELAPSFKLIEKNGAIEAKILSVDAEVPALLEKLRERNTAGLILFTSGTSGKPKAVVHDFDRLLSKFLRQRRAMVTINFLLFDHWGGLNTFFHCFASNCVLVFPRDRTPDHIGSLIEEHKVELLPATPSFLNMLLISGAHKRYDFGSLQLISYGAEPMPQSTLDICVKNLPGVELRQTYGMIEIGVLQAKSKDKSSLWLKIGGDEYDIRVVDGILQVKTPNTMLGYIGEETPITDDGYFITGDAVEQDGEWLRILGRKSEIIMVGAEKVYPIEVESTLLEHPLVADVVVFGESNPILGAVLCAKVQPISQEYDETITDTLREFVGRELKPYMRPLKYDIVSEIGTGSRAKKARSSLKQPTG